MRHDHPRSEPLTDHAAWCRACVVSGTTTAEEVLYDPPQNRGRIRVGMTATWMQLFTYSDGRQDEYKQLTGQVWSRAGDRITSWSYARDRWFVVDSDGESWKVQQDDLEILETV